MDLNEGSDLFSDPSLASVKRLTDLAEIQDAFEQAQKEEVSFIENCTIELSSLWL